VKGPSSRRPSSRTVTRARRDGVEAVNDSSSRVPSSGCLSRFHVIMVFRASGPSVRYCRHLTGAPASCPRTHGPRLFTVGPIQNRHLATGPPAHQAWLPAMVNAVCKDGVPQEISNCP